MKRLKDEELCKLVKDGVLEDHPEAYRELVKDPTHLCARCGRVANDKKRLCKPERIQVGGE